MTQLVKAQLQEISGDAEAREIGAPIDVQFNPATLRLTISNRTAGGSQPGAQARQKPGTGEVTVSFDLHFDTADEGTTEAPVAVTRKTQIVEKFVRPRGKKPAEQSPPRVQFKWGGHLLIQGVMENANIDLDLFAGDGTPLRAKVGVSIKGQDPRYRYDPLAPSPAAEGTGAGSGPGLPGGGTPGLPAGAPGTWGSPAAPAAVAEALPGESLPQMAARLGLDPAAWRALAAPGLEPNGLRAGQQVVLPEAVPGAPARSVGGTVGTSAAAIAAPGPSTPASLVLAGQALARAGGVGAAIAGARAEADRAATAAGTAAFGLAAPAVPDAAAAKPGYGSGIPLRPRIGGRGAAPVARNAATPGWEGVPQVLPTAQATAPGAFRPRSTAACGCNRGS